MYSMFDSTPYTEVEKNKNTDYKKQVENQIIEKYFTKQKIKFKIRIKITFDNNSSKFNVKKDSY